MYTQSRIRHVFSKVCLVLLYIPSYGIFPSNFLRRMRHNRLQVCCRDKYPCMLQKYFLDLKFSWFQGVNSLFEVSGLEFLFTWIKDCEIYIKYIKYLRVPLIMKKHRIIVITVIVLEKICP